MAVVHELGRSVLLGGNPARWKAGESGSPNPNTSGIDAWPLALGGERWGGKPPSARELAEFDLVIANTNDFALDAYVPLAQDRSPRTKWVSLIEGGAELYLEPNELRRKLFDASDLVITINRHAEAYFQAWTQTPVRNLGIPYPVEFVAAKAVPFAERRAEIILAHHHYAMPAILMAEATGLESVAFVRRVSRQLKTLPMFLRHRSFDRELSLDLFRRAIHETKTRVMRNQSWEEFLTLGAGARLWIGVDPRYTWARVVLDAAALKMPILTTRSTAHGPDLFPETTIADPFDVVAGKAIACRLAEDADFGEAVAKTAHTKVWDYAPEPTVRRLEQALLG